MLIHIFDKKFSTKLYCPDRISAIICYLGLDGGDNVEETKLSIKGCRHWPLSFVNLMGLTLLIIFPTPNVELAKVNSSEDVKKVNKISDSLKNGFFSKPVR